MANNASLFSTISSLSPTLYYKCDETSGATVVDYGTSKANLTLSGVYTLAANALISGDTTKFINFTSNNTVSGGKAQGNLSFFPIPVNYDYTLTCIVKLYPNTSSYNTHIFSIGTTGGNANANIQLDLYYRSANTTTVFVENHQNGAKVSNTSLFTNRDEVNRINFVVLKNSSSTNTLSLYVFNANNILVNQMYTIGGFNPSTNTVTYISQATGGANATINIGQTGDNTATNSFDVGHLAFFNRQLTNTEIYNIGANAGFTNIQTNLGIDSNSNTYSANISSYFTANTTNKTITIHTDYFQDPTSIRPELGYNIGFFTY